MKPAPDAEGHVSPLPRMLCVVDCGHFLRVEADEINFSLAIEDPESWRLLANLIRPEFSTAIHCSRC